MAKTQVARVIHPDGSETVLRPAAKGKFTLEELQKMVGGYIEVVFLERGNGRGTAYVNEEGKLQNPPLAVNHKATKMVKLRPDDYIVGNLVIVTREERGK